MGPSRNKTRVGVGRELPSASDYDVATVAAKGDVDADGIAACDYVISQAGEHVRHAVLDLTEATHIDYRSAPTLVARRRWLKARGGELAVAAGRADVRNILRAAAGSEIPVFVTMEEAMSYVKGEADLVGVGSGKQVRKARTTLKR